MNTISRKELDKKGLVVNPHMWLSSGWIYCKICKDYTKHYAMSHKGKSDCYEVCSKCENYSR